MRWAGVWRTRCSLVGKCPRSINKSARRAQHNKTPNVPAARPPTDCTKYGGVVHGNHLAHAHTHIHLPARAASSLTLTDSSSASPSRLTPASISASLHLPAAFCRITVHTRSAATLPYAMLRTASPSRCGVPLPPDANMSILPCLPARLRGLPAPPLHELPRDVSTGQRNPRGPRLVRSGWSLRSTSAHPNMAEERLGLKLSAGNPGSFEPSH